MIATSFTSSSAAFREKEISFAANWVRKQFTTAEPFGLLRVLVISVHRPFKFVFDGAIAGTTLFRLKQ